MKINHYHKVHEEKEDYDSDFTFVPLRVLRGNINRSKLS